MLRVPVDSSDIVAIGYDAPSRTLEVEFKEGRIYQYVDVAPDVHERFMRAESYGEFFFAFINKHYRYQRIQEQTAKTKPAKLAVVTGNAGKFHDVKAVCEPLGIEVEQLDLPVEEIQSHDNERVVTHKAKQAYKLAGRPVLVQDTFWNIIALRGFPGAYMRYVSEWLKPEEFLALLQDKADRTVVRTHAVAYYDGKHVKLLMKDFTGTITTAPRGDGETIDRLVVTAGQTLTNAELRQKDGAGGIKPIDSAWMLFAKWYLLQKRLGRV